MKALLSLTLVSLLSAPALAKPAAKKSAPPAVVNLLEKAHQEIDTEGVKSQNATDARVNDSGVLRLEDPGLRPDDSPWKWLLGLRVQNLQAQGESKMANGQSFRLDGTSSMMTPFLEVGVRRKVHETQAAKWNATLRLEGGYSTQKTDVFFVTGAKAANSRLTTTLAGVTLLGGYTWQRLPSWEFNLGYGEGLVSYAQSATNDAANFTDEGRYQAWTVGATYWLNQDWGVGAEQTQRSLVNRDSRIQLQSGNFSISTRVMW
ncbi:MAG: hypothetical protein KF865_11170 [Bdellovibrionaceae bacterium]|nr:hypothetical protein [Pseudobdellovibrionaceae bacterium]